MTVFLPPHTQQVSDKSNTPLNMLAPWLFRSHTSSSFVQVLPKHALEAVLVGLCDSPLDESARASAGAWGGVSHGGGAGGGVGGNGGKPGEVKEAASSSPSCCVWTELTTPVITAALNLKPALSDKTIAALVRGVEAGADQPKLLVCVRAAGLRRKEGCKHEGWPS